MKSKKDYPCELNQSNYSWSPIILHDDLWEIVNVIVSPNNKYCNSCDRFPECVRQRVDWIKDAARSIVEVNTLNWRAN